jgi:hypothetical protein
MGLTEVKAIKMDHVRLEIEIQVDSDLDFKQFYSSAGLERMIRKKGLPHRQLLHNDLVSCLIIMFILNDGAS